MKTKTVIHLKRSLLIRCFALALTAMLFFSTHLSIVVHAKVYEDKYAGNEQIGKRTSEMYEALYEVNNHSGLEQHVIMHFVVQPKDNVKQNDFIYKFEGKFNSEDEWGTHEYEFDFGSPVEYGEMGTVTLNGENAYLYQAQFGIYPGYYNFYNFGHNYLAWDSASNVCLMKTLTKDFSLTAKDENGEEVWVEVEETGDPHIYVIVGEKTWIEKVGADFENWAVEYEAQEVTNGNEQENVEEETEAIPEDIEQQESNVSTEDTEEMKAIYSVNPRHYEDITNDESIEDWQKTPIIVTDDEKKEELGSVTYVAIDGMGYPFGMGAHYEGFCVCANGAAKPGYRFVNMRATSNVSVSEVYWVEDSGEYRYDIIVPRGDSTLYFYYEPKDYSITVDEKLSEYITVQPYGDEGELVPIRISNECPYEVLMLLENGNTEKLELVDQITEIEFFDYENNRISDSYKYAFEMYGSPIKLVPLEGTDVDEKIISETNSNNKTPIFIFIAGGTILFIAGGLIFKRLRK